MTQFEFISVAVSIVLALSAARLLTAIPHVLAPGRRYWIHALWSVLLLLMHLSFWWAIWIYREIDPWTFRGFVAVMLTPAFLYLTVNLKKSNFFVWYNFKYFLQIFFCFLRSLYNII